MQELAPPEPEREDPFEGAEAEAAEPAAVVEQEPEEETEAGEAAAGDAEMADAEPKQAEEDVDVVELLEEETVHMPASQDDPGTCWTTCTLPACTNRGKHLRVIHFGMLWLGTASCNNMSNLT